MKKEFRWMISTFLIFSAFFSGIFFEKTHESTDENKSFLPIVNITEKSNGFEVRKNSPEIQIFINGKELEGTGTIIQKKLK